MTRQSQTIAQLPWNRQVLNDELFRRAPVPVATHALVTHSAVLQDAAQMRDAAEYLRNALRSYGQYQESGDHDYRIMRIGDAVQVKCERHTEFTDYTQVAAANGQTPFAEDAGSISTAWMNALPGLRIAASKLLVLPQSDKESVARAVASLSAPTSSSTVADGQARIWADCRIQDDGYTRILVVDSGMQGDRRARLIQRLLEIEDYRMLAMLGFVPAKSIMTSLQGMETQLQNLMTEVANSHPDHGQGDGEKILRQLLGLAAREAADLDRRDRHVPHHAHVREEVEALEDEPDLSAELDEVHPRPGDDVALEADLPALDRLEPVDAAEERRLAGAGRADQADDLVRVDREADALQHLVVRVALADGVDLEEGHQSARTPVFRACRRIR